MTELSDKLMGFIDLHSQLGREFQSFSTSEDVDVSAEQAGILADIMQNYFTKHAKEYIASEQFSSKFEGKPYTIDLCVDAAVDMVDNSAERASEELNMSKEKYHRVVGSCLAMVMMGEYCYEKTADYGDYVPMRLFKSEMKPLMVKYSMDLFGRFNITDIDENLIDSLIQMSFDNMLAKAGLSPSDYE